MIARTVGLFAEMQILAVKDFQRWWLSHRPNVALTMEEWQEEFEAYLRQGMSAPKQPKKARSLGRYDILFWERNEIAIAEMFSRGTKLHHVK